MLPLPCTQCFLDVFSRHRDFVAHHHQYHGIVKLCSYTFFTGMVCQISFGNSMVSMLSQSERICYAQKVFDRLFIKTDLSWNSLLSGYFKQGNMRHALTTYQRMQQDGHACHLNSHIIVLLLKACATLNDIQTGRELDALISDRMLLEKNQHIGNALIDMYAKCGDLDKAKEVFSKLPMRDVVSWNILIAGYLQHESEEVALKCFDEMKEYPNIVPDGVTFTSCLKACGRLTDIDHGQSIHADILRRGLFKGNVAIGNALVDMYVKCGSLAKANEVFERLSVRTVVSWTTLIAGLACHGYSKQALDFYEKMGDSGILADETTIVCTLTACGHIEAIDKGRKIHSDVEYKGLLGNNSMIGTALIDMYAKCGILSAARKVFEKLSICNVVTWNALIGGYVERAYEEEAIDLFEQMQYCGVSPDSTTHTCMLKACGSIGALEKGRKIHIDVEKKGMLTSSQHVGNALVDMYAKCGMPVNASNVFECLPVRNIVSWNTILSGYAQLGEICSIVQMFVRMVQEGIKPTSTTFLSILYACSHSGYIQMGHMVFENMPVVYDVTPTLQHQSCMIDLLGRAGQLELLEVLINRTTLQPNVVMWHAVLGACQKLGHVDLGSEAFDQALCLDGKGGAPYLCMYKMYLGAAMQDHAKKIIALEVEKQAWW